jgi:hypothetical protein
MNPTLPHMNPARAERGPRPFPHVSYQGSLYRRIHFLATNFSFFLGTIKARRKDQQEKTKEDYAMTRAQFWQGMGIGIAAGTVVGLAIQPRKKSIKERANKAMRAVGGTMENITDNIGM